MTDDIGLDPWATVWRENYHAMMSLTGRVWTMLEHGDASSVPEWMQYALLKDVLNSDVLRGAAKFRAEEKLEAMDAAQEAKRERVAAYTKDALARIPHGA